MLTPRLVGRFVREVLPKSAMYYGDGLPAFLGELAPGIEEAFRCALKEVADQARPCGDIRAIVAGACVGESAEFEQAIGLFGRSYEDAERWLKGAFAQELREAEEHEVDAAFVDWTLEEPGERLFNADTGMEAVVRLRGASEGLRWIAGHRYRARLIRAAAQVISDGDLAPRPGELRLLLDEANDCGREAVWNAAARCWDDDLSDMLKKELVRGGERLSYRKSLVRVAQSRDGEGADWVDGVAEVVVLASQERQLELVYDVVATDRNRGADGVEGTRVVVERLSEGMSEPVGELGAATGRAVGRVGRN